MTDLPDHRWLEGRCIAMLHSLRPGDRFSYSAVDNAPEFTVGSGSLPRRNNAPVIVVAWDGGVVPSAPCGNCGCSRDDGRPHAYLTLGSCSIGALP